MLTQFNSIKFFICTTPEMANEVYFVGVDVGSGSVRAALVDRTGHVARTSVKELQTWKPRVDFYEQSSNDVWDCCVYVIKVIKMFLT